MTTFSGFRGAAWLAAPLALYYLVFFISPLAVLVIVSLFSDTTLSAVGLRQYVAFFGDIDNLAILVDTLRLGTLVTALNLVLGYSVAYVYLFAGSIVRAGIVLLVITPLLTSTVVRAFAWIVILGRQGPINAALVEFGVTATPLRMLYTETGLVLALAQIEMALMVLPLISVMARIDPNLLDASAALGASRFRTFWKVLLPLSLPGAIAGSILVFAAAMSAFVSQSLIGGGRLIYMPFHLYEQSVALQNWPFAAAISVILMTSVLIVVSGLIAFSRVGARLGHA